GLDLPRHRLALAAQTLIADGLLPRLRQCEACSWLFLDTSRGGRRRWCSMATCGNRAKARRHYRAQSLADLGLPALNEAPHPGGRAMSRRAGRPGGAAAGSPRTTSRMPAAEMAKPAAMDPVSGSSNMAHAHTAVTPGLKYS